MNKQPIIIEKTFDATVSKVWNAISDKNEMKHWYFDLEEFKPEVGFKFQFSGGPDDGTQYLHLCEVTSAKPNERLSYIWKYQGYKGESEVIFELTDRVDQTLLKLTLKVCTHFQRTIQILPYITSWKVGIKSFIIL